MACSASGGSLTLEFDGGAEGHGRGRGLKEIEPKIGLCHQRRCAHPAEVACGGVGQHGEVESCHRGLG